MIKRPGTVFLFSLFVFGFEASGFVSGAPRAFSLALLTEKKNLRNIVVSHVKRVILRESREDAGRHPKITVYAISSFDPEFFNRFDTVLILSLGSRDTLSPVITDFIRKNRDQKKKILVMALLPGSSGRQTLRNPPAGIDVMSAASRKEPAETLIREKLIPALKSQSRLRR